MRRSAYIGIVILTFFTTGLYGQWKHLASFNSQIVSIHFLSREGRSEIGFVGTANGKVWKTTDRGNSWTVAGTPTSLVGRVRSFTFKDSLIGWLSTGEDSKTPCVYRTIDGGRNWAADTLYGVGTSIMYNPRATPQKTLVLTTWSGYNMLSTNDGLSWSRIGQTQEMCGVAYNNNNFGVMTAAQSKTITVTSNGGRTWTTLFGQVEEMWHPLAINNTNTFFAAAELAGQIRRSDNSGWDWDIIYQFPRTVDLTGYIGGSLKALFVQAKNGVYVSIDSGQSWKEYCGPGNDYDTRMFVVGDTLYAGTVDGKLYVNSYGVSRNKELLEFSADKLDFLSTGCFRLDSSIRLTNLSTCLKVKLIDVEVVGNASLGAISTPLPKQLGATDSIRLYYIPSDLKQDSADLIITYQVGDSIYEKRIKLYGNGKSGINVSLSREFDMLLASDCAKLDTFILFRNGPCDTVELVSASVTDISTFTLGATLPVTILPNSTFKLPISVNTVTPGTYNATVVVRFKLGQSTLDTFITLNLKVLSAKEPLVAFSKPVVRFDSVSTCDIKYDTVVITNTICKQLTIETVTIAPSDPTLTVIHTPVTPRTLLPNESDSVIVAYAPSQTAPLAVNMTVRTGFDATTVRDTVITITGQGKAFGDAILTSSALTFESLYPCEEGQLLTALVNLSCDSATIIDIEYPADGGFQIVDPQVLTDVAPGDTLPVRIKVGPISPGSKFDSVRIRVRTKSGAERLLKLTLLGTVKQRVRRVDLTSVLRLDSIAPCSVFDTFVYLRNKGICDTLLIDSITLSVAPWITIDPLSKPPFSILPGDSIGVWLNFSPPPNGASTGWLRLLGSGFDTSISIQVGTGKYIDPMPLSISDSNFTAFLCSNARQTLSIANPLCDTLVLDTIALAGSNQFSFSSTPLLPMRLLPGESITITIEFDPSLSGDSTAEFTVRCSEFGVLKRIALAGSYRNTKGIMPLEAVAPGGAKQIVAGQNQFPVINIRSNDFIERARNLTAMKLTLRFNDNVVTVNDIWSDDWQYIREDSFGLLRLNLWRNAAGDIAANDNIVSVRFQTFIGDSSWTPVTISQVLLNPDDSIYQACVLEPLAMSPIIITIDDTCGDAFIRRWINKDLDLFDNFSIRPNPSDGAREVLVTFDLKYERSVILSVFDANGRRIADHPYSALPKGKNELRIPTPSLAEGWCFITIEAPEQRDLRKLILR